MAYEKKDNYPSFKVKGTYPPGSDKELGLDNEDLEKSSLGNWTSIVKNNRKFFTSQSNIIENISEGDEILGRPIKIDDIVPLGSTGNDIGFFEQRVVYKNFSKQGAFFSLPPRELTTGLFFNFDHLKLTESTTRNVALGDNVISPLSGSYNLLKELLEDNFAYIVSNENEYDLENDDELLNAPINFKFKEEVQEQIDEILNNSRVENYTGITYDNVPDDWLNGDGYVYISRQLYIEPPTKYLDGTDVIYGDNEQGVFIRATDTFFTNFVQSEVTSKNENIYSSKLNQNYLYNAKNLGHPNYTLSFPLGDDNVSNFIPEDVDLNVYITPPSGLDLISVDDVEQQTPFIFYDQSNLNFLTTSYPVKVNLTINLQTTNFLNRIAPVSDDDESTLLNVFFSSVNQDELVANLLSQSISAKDSVYYYKVIQWGDEKNIKNDSEILNSEYFNSYNLEDYPAGENYYYKRLKNNLNLKVFFDTNIRNHEYAENDFKPIRVDNFLPITNHVYNRPGVKSIKIIILRLNKNLTILNETRLVTKNIVINDGLLSSQDFEIFGGTDFNFLPIVENQAIIGGFDTESKYDNSVSKIVKDDSFVQDDYLEKSSAKNYIEKINDGSLGKQPGQLDLGQVRVFKEARDIYDFIGGDKLKWIVSGSDTLPVNSLATDIFIRDNKCVVDLNPSDTEYSAIQNKAGLKEVGVVVGDYKVNQPQGGRIQKQGVMDIPILDTDNEKQAF